MVILCIQRTRDESVTQRSTCNLKVYKHRVLLDVKILKFLLSNHHFLMIEDPDNTASLISEIEDVSGPLLCGLKKL